MELCEEELPAIKDIAILASVVQQGQEAFVLGSIQIWVDVPVEHAKQDHRQTSENDVVQLDVPFIEHSHCTKATVVGKVVVRQRQSDVLVKEIQDERRNAFISRSAVYK